jgi:hypothetical protein
MVEAWSYGRNIFVYDPSLVVWCKQVFLCSSLVFNTLKLLHALIISNYFKIKDVLSPSSSLFMHLQNAQTYVDFLKKNLRLGSYANLLKPCFIPRDRLNLRHFHYFILYILIH